MLLLLLLPFLTQKQPLSSTKVFFVINNIINNSLPSHYSPHSKGKPILPAHRPYELACAMFLCNRWYQFPLVVEALPPPSATQDTPYILLTKNIEKLL